MKMIDPQDAPRKPGEMFEILVNGVSRTMRDVRSVAIGFGAADRGARTWRDDQHRRPSGRLRGEVAALARPA